MGIIRVRRTPLLISAGAALAACCLAVVPALASGGKSATPGLGAVTRHSGKCIEITLVEKLIKYYPQSDHLTGTGVFGTYYDRLYTTATSTDVMATGIGTFDTLYLAPNGHIMEWVTEQWQFPDGTFVGSGLFDRTAMLAGHLVHTPLVGASGVYKGMHGQVVWNAFDLSNPIPPALDKISLCRR